MRQAFVLLACIALGACTTTTTAPAIDLARADLIDLTWPYDDKTLYWPTSPSAFELKELAYGPTPGGWFYSSYAICTPEHGGTHLDAPIHFAEGKQTVDRIPLERLVAPAIVIDVADRAATNADYRLTADDVRAWEARHGTIAPGTIVMLRTGWGQRWPNRKSYFGDDTPGKTDNLHFPSYGEDSARLLVEERRVAAIGVDTASIDYGQSRDFLVHRVVGAANVVGLENLTNLGDVPATGAWIVALPLKITRGSGAPARVVAFVPR